jgi:hypothetical protein
MTDDSSQVRIVPTLASRSSVIDAPGMGVLPAISLHSAATPLLYDLNAQPINQMSALIQRQ